MSNQLKNKLKKKFESHVFFVVFIIESINDKKKKFVSKRLSIVPKIIEQKIRKNKTKTFLN
jgi:hypothetical protein